MVTDTSGSMLAKDVRPGPPDRRARGGADADRQVPEDFRLGLVKFGSQRRAGRRADDRPRRGWSSRCARCAVKGATAMGDGLQLGLRGRAHAGAGRPRRHAPAAGGDRAALRRREHARRRPDRRRRSEAKRAEDPHLHGRARHARAACSRRRGPDGTIRQRDRAARHADAAGDRARDRRALLQRARRRPARGGLLRASARASRRATEKQEVTAAFAGGGLVLLLGGLALSLLRGGRLP